MKMTQHAALTLLLCLVLTASAFAVPSRVVEVVDGNTLTIEPAQGGERAGVRLHGVDAPKLRQPYGQAAQVFVINAVLYKTVDVQPTPHGTDRAGRIMAIVEIPGAGILQEMLLSEGLARVHTQDCKDCGAWEVLQEAARAQRKGLWGGEPAEPWEWSRFIKEAKTLREKR